MNKIDASYLSLVTDILENGSIKEDRTGTGTKSVFGRMIRHDMSDGFPLLTTKKMAWKTMVTELLWFLRGETNIRPLVLDGCNIWNGDCYKAYLKNNNYDGSLEPIVLSMKDFIEKIKNDVGFGDKYGKLGPIYGSQWRKWQALDSSNMHLSIYEIDQITSLIKDIKKNPDSRRLIVNAWNVGDIKESVLPPCHFNFQVYTRELTVDEYTDLMVEKHGMIVEGGDDELPTRKISLMWNQRSGDLGLGIPFNIASYGLLLTILGKIVNMVPHELIGALGDVHLYSNHLEPIKEQLNRKSFELPMIKHLKSDEFYRELGNDFSKISELSKDDFILENYQSHDKIDLPLSN